MMKSFPAFGILLRTPSKKPALVALLESNSGLPGPRANLELAYSFAKACVSIRLAEWQWNFLREIASIPPGPAPVNSPKVFLPFCGLLAVGSLYGEGLPRPRRRDALALLKRAASDPRWRIREGAAMGFQLLGEKDPQSLRSIIEEWLPRASIVEKRAIIAALAHPPLLGDAHFAMFCLDTADSVLNDVRGLDGGARRSEGFRILKKGLGYALSVFVQHRPTEGFALLRKWAAVKDLDINRIVKENLRKKRLATRFVGEAREVALIAGRGARS